MDQDKPRIWSTFRADKTVPDDFYDIDGGIFSNSPLNLAISVLNKYANDDIRNKVLKKGISVISIGTGHEDLSKFTPPFFNETRRRVW